MARIASKLTIRSLLLLTFLLALYTLCMPRSADSSSRSMRFSTSSLLAGAGGMLAGTKSGSISGHQLRIMPLGASITTGTGSTTHNGYRASLEKYLVHDQNTVDFVGSQAKGNMSNNHFEAYSGAIIQGLIAPTRKAVPIYRPNLVLVLLGNNDAKWGKEKGAPERMRDLTELIFQLEPTTTIIVAQLPPNTVESTDLHIREFNAGIVPLIKKQQLDGKRITWVDTYTPLNKTTDMSDDTHPNDAGFEKIATEFYKGVQAVLKLDWVQKPRSTHEKDPTSTTSPEPDATAKTGFAKEIDGVTVQDIEGPHGLKEVKP